MVRLCLLVCFLLAGCDDAPVNPEADQGVTPEVWGQAFDATAEGAFLSVFGPGPDDIWTVGGQPEQGAVWHFDGTTWAAADPPDGPLFNWVHGAGDRLWMVGNGGRILTRMGDGFAAVDSPVTAPLWGVWAASADEAWAVGGEARDDGQPADPVLLHFSGGQWTRQELPPIDRSFRAIFKVFGLAANDVYAVGAKGVILHWDGQAWAQQASGTGEDLISLWGNRTDDLVIVGGRGNGVLARLIDGAWHAEVVTGQPGFNGVFVQADGTAFVAGGRGLLLRVAAGAFVGERRNSGTREVLHGIWGTSAGHRIAVGGSLDTSPPWVGVALESGR